MTRCNSLHVWLIQCMFIQCMCTFHVKDMVFGAPGNTAS